MKILNNISSTHYNELKNIILDTDELIIVSPFLMESFDNFFVEIKDMGIKHISLITTLKDNSLDLLKKSNSIHSFCFNCKMNEINYSIYIDNQLHGKVYISLKNGIPLKGIITSANFTKSGLEQNHEWGILTEDSHQIRNLLDEIKSVSSRELSSEELDEIIKKIDTYCKGKVIPKENKIDLSVSDILNKRKKRITFNKRYFIKPVGVSDDPFPENRILSSAIEKLHFSKKRPASVGVGDVLICYAVGTTKLLGYFEVIEGPYLIDEKPSRWPWEVKGKNLCPAYSERWNTFNNTISSIQASYDFVAPVTKNNKGNNLNGLMFGLDKIQLTEEFATHVIKIIEDSE
ncbi:restriction endonuclease PLD domain-containing protein [Bacillus toyonensis]|uniref:restriction endonuclease PLD domain-containing protein n=1 Tax=Bacillus toyonensis TaxID=155322 RepID=UPI000BECC1B9|nr:restriction endonuclease PLD domain-containing protein [Bacillus toyonensis]PDY52292.1 restriction endonuclease [Bacillus toyonensis]